MIWGPGSGSAAMYNSADLQWTVVASCGRQLRVVAVYVKNLRLMNSEQCSGDLGGGLDAHSTLPGSFQCTQRTT